MKSRTPQELIKRIEELHQIHLSLRGIIQYVGKHHKGKRKLNWGSKIPSNYIDIQITFRNEISDSTRKELNELSEFINQNFIIRLHSLLEYEGIKNEQTKIDKELEGYEMVEFIHFLRKEFAHKTGYFNSINPESKKLRERLFDYFNIKPTESLPNQFPLDKNRVIKPIVEGTKKYVKSFWNKYRK